MIETITRDGALLALIIPHHFREQRIHFTPPELSQQLAFMCHAAGKTIDAHVHNTHGSIIDESVPARACGRA